MKDEGQRGDPEMRALLPILESLLIPSKKLP
jgi:hypothetical protein